MDPRIEMCWVAQRDGMTVGVYRNPKMAALNHGGGTILMPGVMLVITDNDGFNSVLDWGTKINLN